MEALYCDVVRCPLIIRLICDAGKNSGLDLGRSEVAMTVDLSFVASSSVCWLVAVYSL